MFGLEGVLITGLFKIFFAIVGVGAWRLTLIWMDRYNEKSNSEFAIWLRKANDEKKALYYAGRNIAVALVIASAIS